MSKARIEWGSSEPPTTCELQESGNATKYRTAYNLKFERKWRRIYKYAGTVAIDRFYVVIDHVKYDVYFL